ncbi:hypothetical protein AS94_08670 [Staphylococcus aureus subsp. aureus 300-169]|nr:hypothetical protein AS94_08670 [Staphylococcus aureus subsp. aureus 300-169]EUN37208.1 hypothetical protein AS94_10880 [Staphylococcus aureus subsp. aureus 301-188]
MYPVHFLCTICALKNKKPTTTKVADYIMETAGFEPASRGPDTHLSTCVVYRKVSHHEK